MYKPKTKQELEEENKRLKQELQQLKQEKHLKETPEYLQGIDPFEFLNKVEKEIAERKRIDPRKNEFAEDCHEWPEE